MAIRRQKDKDEERPREKEKRGNEHATTMRKFCDRVKYSVQRDICGPTVARG